jgi:hypothetical protein
MSTNNSIFYQGKFGAVMKGLLDEQDKTGVPGYLVAVKMAKDEGEETKDTVEEMKLEGAIMAQFTHPNVVGLIGQVRAEKNGIRAERGRGGK